MTLYSIRMPRNGPLLESGRPGPDIWLRLVLTWMVEVAARGRTRRRLARLDPHLLEDIGLTRDDVLRECAKPFWR